MKAERPGALLRRVTLAAAAAALTLSHGAGAAPAQEESAARDEQAAAQVTISDADLSPCGPWPTGAQTAAEKMCLRGGVRSVTTEARRARAREGGGFVEGALYSVARATFNERGDVTLWELSDSANGPGPVGVVFRRGVSTFDELGRQTASKWYEAGADEPSSVVAYEYDGRGNRVKVDSRRTKPDGHHVTESEYDAEGREVGTSSSSLTPGGRRTTRHRKVTRVEGRLTSVRTYSAGGVLRGRADTLRDERGATLSEELYVADARGIETLRLRVTYGYDGGGFLTEAVYHKAAASLGARAVYEYDAQGNCVSLTRRNADGTVAAAARREYEYDAAGNWVTCVSLARPREGRAPEPYNVVRRRIAYQ